MREPVIRGAAGYEGPTRPENANQPSRRAIVD